jgi:hypothetical protein
MQVEVPKRSLEPIRFGEFLFEQALISEEDLLNALGEHWSNGGRIGAAVTRLGLLDATEVERQAAAYHELDIVEVDSVVA